MNLNVPENPVSLDQEQSRQITQFLIIADHYMSEASKAAEMQETLGLTKARFRPPATITSTDRELAIIGAHLSSAAIRLASIEHVLDDAKQASASFKACRTYFNGKGTEDPRAATCSEWLHVMLRDNAGHAEPQVGPDDKTTKTIRRAKRQDTLKDLTFKAVYEKLSEISAEIRDRLTNTHGLSINVE